MIDIQDIFDNGNDELYRNAINKCTKLLDDTDFNYTNVEAKAIVEKAFVNMKGLLK